MIEPALVDRLRAALPGAVEPGSSLARLTTYRVGGPAEVLVRPAGPDDVRRLADVLAAEPEPVPTLVLGRGSNLVVSDAGFPGVVVHLAQGFSWIRTAGDLEVEVGAGTRQPQVANWAARRGLAGAEFMIAIPGSIGGAVRMNAGAHGAETAGILSSIRLVSLATGAYEVRRAAELGFGYRRSLLGESDLVLDARLAFRDAAADEIVARTESYRRHRAATQPGAAQNAGSVFKNPEGDHAGRLVEAAGLKGFRIGGARVSEIHANFFIADEGARAADVFGLVRAVQRAVHERSGVPLEPEISFVGPFDDQAPGIEREGT